MDTRSRRNPGSGSAFSSASRSLRKPRWKMPPPPTGARSRACGTGSPAGTEPIRRSGDMLQKTHDERIKEQIRQYANTENMHGQLADIFRYWQEKYFKPRFADVCRVNNHLEFYAKPMAERIRRTGVRDLISFGCGDAQVEVGVANVLKRDGV